MVLLPALVLGFIAALVVPFAVQGSPDTFGGLLRGSMFHIPMTDSIIHIAWPVFLVVSLLWWVLFRLAKG